MHLTFLAVGKWGDERRKKGRKKGRTERIDDGRQAKGKEGRELTNHTSSQCQEI